MGRCAIILCSFLVAATALGQPKNEFSVFVTEANINSGGTRSGQSFGAAFDRMFSPRISAQLAVGSERHRSYAYIVNPNGTFTATDPVGFRTYPIDFSVRYHFVNDTRWHPYAGLGARYVRQPHVSSQFNYQDHIGPEIVGGTAFQLTRSFGLVVDGKVYLGDREQYDSQLKTSFGLLWRF